ncbi:MAG TPA: hypothetical protein VEW64_02395 [Methyloceanibacter sp.]|nr:hypothetical protein [Methyloceanibacter sp.]
MAQRIGGFEQVAPVRQAGQRVGESLGVSLQFVGQKIRSRHRPRRPDKQTIDTKEGKFVAYRTDFRSRAAACHQNSGLRPAVARSFFEPELGASNATA